MVSTSCFLGMAVTTLEPGHGKRGIEKQPFQLPDFIAATGIEKIRQFQVVILLSNTKWRDDILKIKPRLLSDIVIKISYLLTAFALLSLCFAFAVADEVFSLLAVEDSSYKTMLRYWPVEPFSCIYWQAYIEKEDNKKLKQKQREHMQPKMGKMDIDYHEGKEFEVTLAIVRPLMVITSGK
ncbi:splicing factor 3B subunit 2 isoform X2 [Tanacetum coccineum]